MTTTYRILGICYGDNRAAFNPGERKWEPVGMDLARYDIHTLAAAQGFYKEARDADLKTVILEACTYDPVADETTFQELARHE